MGSLLFSSLLFSSLLFSSLSFSSLLFSSLLVSSLLFSSLLFSSLLFSSLLFSFFAVVVRRNRSAISDADASEFEWIGRSSTAHRRFQPFRSSVALVPPGHRRSVRA